MSVRCAIFQAPRRIELRDVKLEQLGPFDVLVDVEACGVCGSDIGSYEFGHYVVPGQVMGHEISARVAALGSRIGGLRVGMQIAIRPMGTCGECAYCRSGNSNLCSNSVGRSLGYGLQGGFAEQVVLRDVVVGADVIAIEDALLATDLMWAEPLAVAVHAIHLLGEPPVNSLLVVGAGSVGLCVTAAALASGVSEVVVIEPREQRRVAVSSLGATAHESLQNIGDREFGGAIDTSGIAQVIETASQRVSLGGYLVLLGLGDLPVPWPAGVARLSGSFGYTDADFRIAVDHIVTGRVRLSRFVTHQFALEDTARALAVSSIDPSTVKVAVIPRRTHVQD